MYVKLIYYDRKTEDVCTNINKAIKHFGGNKNMAISLFSRINALISAETIKDICAQPQFHFHKLFNKGRNKNLEGYVDTFIGVSEEIQYEMIKPRYTLKW